MVVRGNSEITNEYKIINLNVNKFKIIECSEIHRFTNPGKTLLENIEVQSGSYLGDDDIVRIEDIYGIY